MIFYQTLKDNRMANMFSITIWSLKYFVHNWRKNFQHNKFIPEINVAFPTPTSIKIFTKLFFEKYHNILFPKSFLWGNYKVLIPIIWEMACISMVDFIFPFCNKLALNKTRRIFFWFDIYSLSMLQTIWHCNTHSICVFKSQKSVWSWKL